MACLALGAPDRDPSCGDAAGDATADRFDGLRTLCSLSEPLKERAWEATRSASTAPRSPGRGLGSGEPGELALAFECAIMAPQVTTPGP